mgnify:CR=1 FL=1
MNGNAAEALKIMRANLPAILISGTRLQAARAQLLYAKCSVVAAASTNQQLEGKTTSITDRA